MVHTNEDVKYDNGNNQPHTNTSRFSLSIPLSDDSDVAKAEYSYGPCTSPLITCRDHDNTTCQDHDNNTPKNGAAPPDNSAANFLEIPPKNKKSKRKKKKVVNKDKRDVGKPRRCSTKTIDSIPASIPEENSEDIISSDPDIETVEYVKTSEHEYDHQHTVHSVHQIFAELDELVREEGEDVWEEKARWIKFEQDIYRGADKWSKPHVATLRLQSIIGLRKCITRGTVLLGMNAFDLESVIEMLLDRLVSRALITSNVAVQLRTLLLKRHVHIGEHQDMMKFRYNRKNRTSRRGFLSRISEGLSPTTSPSASRLNSRNNSEQDLNKIKQQFLRKLPADTEASNVMIGKLDYLEVPICVTIRLNHSILLGDVTEVPIPTRFIFLLLCPPNSKIDHVEVGRAASTLFSDEMFYKAAYSATSKAHLIQGIDRFLEKAIVIPPGEWDPKMKIVLPEEEGSPEELSDKEDEVIRIENNIHIHTMPLGGIRCDIQSLRIRWVKDWKRGLQRIPLLCPIQYSIVTLSYILFLVQLSWKSLHITAFSGLCSVGLFGILSSVCFCQPLVMCSVSVPVVLWEVAVAQICGKVGVSYTDVRALVGVLAGITLITTSVFNIGNLIPSISMFVYESAIAAIPISVFIFLLILLHSLSFLSEPNIVVCSIVVLLATLIFLKLWHGLGTSTIFSKKIRTTFCIFDGAVLILVVSLLIYIIPLTTLPYEHGYLSSLQPFPSQLTYIIISVAAGGFLSVLVFLQYGVVFNWVIQPNHKLKRLHGKYFDQLLIGTGIILSGLYHLPFLVPDPLLTGVFIHILSLTSTNTNDHVVYMREQRVTQLLSGMLVLAPAAILPQLHKYIPLPLCWGVVLFYSGICLANTQLYERCLILFQAEKYHPETSYVENTPQNVINSYTIVQMVSVGVLVLGFCVPYVPCSIPLILLFIILLRRYLLPVVMFENLILLLEDKRSPVPVKCISPSPSLTPDMEFSEEVCRISNGHFEQQESVKEKDLLFPQVIFDNLTDNDTEAHKDLDKTSLEESDLQANVVDLDSDEHNANVGRRASSLDFLADPSSIACSLPFEYDLEEPLKSENPYSSFTQPATYLDLYP